MISTCISVLLNSCPAFIVGILGHSSKMQAEGQLRAIKVNRQTNWLEQIGASHKSKQIANCPLQVGQAKFNFLEG